jgi:uncharacterized membrane protein
VTRWLLALFGALPLLAFAVHHVAPHSAVVQALDAWFSLHCHQDPSRTLRVFGHLLPVCARCTGLYAGLLAGALVPVPVATRRRWLGLLGVALAVLLVDVGTQAAGWRVTSLGLRLLTGFMLAFPAARLSLPRAALTPSASTSSALAP